MTHLTDPIVSTLTGQVLRVEAGDRVTEGELVVRYRRGVAVILRNALDGQQVRADEIREPEKLSGFVRSMARNLALGHFRKAPPVESANRFDRTRRPVSRAVGSAGA